MARRSLVLPRRALRAGLFALALLGAASHSTALSLRQETSPHSLNPAILTIPPGVSPESESSPRARPFTLTLRYTVDGDGLARRRALRLAFGYATHNDWHPLYAERGGYLLGPSQALGRLPFGGMQVKEPAEAGYVTARVVEPSERPLSVRIVRDRNQLDWIEVRTDEPLPAGAVVEVLLGDTKHGSPGLPQRMVPGRPEAVWFVEKFSGRFVLDRGPFPTLLCTAERVDALSLSLPMTPAPGSEGVLSLRAMQGDAGPRGNLIMKRDAVGHVRLEVDPPGAIEVADLVAITRDDRGALRVPVRFVASGPVAIRGTWVEAEHDDDRGDVVGWSNVALVEADLPHRIGIGDSQRHCIAGGHATAPEDALWRHHYERGDDYATIVQHVAAQLASWRLALSTARRSQRELDPDETSFIVFPGYEWSRLDQHHHVFHADFSRSLAFSDKMPRDNGEKTVQWAGSLDEFLEALSGLKTPAIAIAHHTMWDQQAFGRQPYEWGPKEDPVRTLLEIYSAHGSSDRHYDTFPPGAWEFPMHWDEKKHEQRPALEFGSAQDALAAGHRFGFVGGSDNHSWAFHRCGRRARGQWREKYGRPGLGAVLGDVTIPSLRNRLVDAFQQRRTYATTGHKSVLFMRLGDAVMGAETTADVGDSFQVRAVASGVARADRASFVRIRVWRDGHDLVHEEALAGESVEWSWNDPDPPRDDVAHPYYIELHHDDHNLTWSSPIWVRYR